MGATRELIHAARSAHAAEVGMAAPAAALSSFTVGGARKGCFVFSRFIRCNNWSFSGTNSGGCNQDHYGSQHGELMDFWGFILHFRVRCVCLVVELEISGRSAFQAELLLAAIDRKERRARLATSIR